MRIAQVMTKDVKAVEPDELLHRAAAIMDDLNVGVVPVCEGRRLVGILTDRDIVVRAIAARKGPETPVREVMTTDLFWCTADSEVGDVLTMMSERQVRRVPVLDEAQNLVGIVALGDLAEDRVPGAGDALRRVSEPAEPDRS